MKILKTLGRTGLLGLSAGLMLGLGVASVPQDAVAAWEPERPVEFVIQTNPGGGSDKYARLWIGIIEKYKLSPVPFIPVNKPGGGGAVALTFLHSKRGDPHYVTPTLNSVITRPLLTKIPVMYPSRDLTPIVMMVMDPFLLVVHPDNFKSFEDWKAACTERTLTSTGTGVKQEDEIQLFLLQRAVGCKPFRYVPQKGGGSVATAVAGKHADFNVNQPAEMLPHYPERLIPILAFSKKRYGAFPDVPTHYEKGVDAKWADLLSMEGGLHQMRGVIGPPGISKEAIEWYANLFRKVWVSKEWQDFMEGRAMSRQFLDHEAYTKFLSRYEDDHLRVMRDVIGWKLRDDLKPK